MIWLGRQDSKPSHLKSLNDNKYMELLTFSGSSCNTGMIRTTVTQGAILASVNHLFRRGAIFYARLRVPLDLVTAMGKSELVKSLGTADHQEAKRLLRSILNLWNAEFDDVRARSKLTASDKDYAAWDHYSDMLNRDEQERTRLPTVETIDAAEADLVRRVNAGEVETGSPLAMLDASLDFLVLKNTAKLSGDRRRIKLIDLRKQISTGETELVAHEVDLYLRQNGLIAPRGTPTWVAIARRMMRAEMEALQRSLERDVGDYSGRTADPLIVPPSVPRRVRAAPGEGLVEVLDIFTRENSKNVSKDRLNQTRRDVLSFADVVGTDFAVASIDKKAVRDWKALLIQFPVKERLINVFGCAEMVA